MAEDKKSQKKKGYQPETQGYPGRRCQGIHPKRNLTRPVWIASRKLRAVSKRTVYNHFPSKEILFQAIVADFLKQRDEIKPIKYASALTLEEQLKEFAKAELFLINDPVRRGLSKLFTSVFLMDIDFGKKTRSQFEPHKAFIIWLIAAKGRSEAALSISGTCRPDFLRNG